MSHQDRKSEGRIVINHESLKQAINTLFPEEAFRKIKNQGRGKWTPRMLVTVALFWTWSAHKGLKERFTEAVELVAKMLSCLPNPGKSYQGFTKQLRKWHVELQLFGMGELRLRMKQDLFGQWQIAGFVVIAGDGSRVELPRTVSNEAAYSPKRKKAKGKGQRSRGKKGRGGKAKRQSAQSIAKKANSPQMWLTLFWHVGTGLSWAWRSGPSGSSERDHLQEMLPELPENSLITADAGFMGYEFWRAVIDAKQSFVIRVGANVHLLKNLGYARQYDNTVYLWPDAAAKKCQLPLVLRVVCVHDGKQPMCLVTNVLSKTRLNDQQVAKIYKARWGIEIFFRTFKQTFGRRKLRSHSAANAQLELDWSLIGLWSVCLLAQCELTQAGNDPGQLSSAIAIKAIQHTMCHYRHRPDKSTESLSSLFRQAVQDGYSRTSLKTARDYPRQKKRERTGVPTITDASTSQIAAALELKRQQHEFRLTA